MASGSASEIVKAVVSGRGGGRPGELVDRPAGALGLQVPEGAVERVAGGARRHGLLQGLAVEPGGKPRRHGLDAAPARCRRLSP